MSVSVGQSPVYVDKSRSFANAQSQNQQLYETQQHNPNTQITTRQQVQTQQLQNNKLNQKDLQRQNSDCDVSVVEQASNQEPIEQSLQPRNINKRKRHMQSQNFLHNNVINNISGQSYVQQVTDLSGCFHIKHSTQHALQHKDEVLYISEFEDKQGLQPQRQKKSRRLIQDEKSIANYNQSYNHNKNQSQNNTVDEVDMHGYSSQDQDYHTIDANNSTDSEVRSKNSQDVVFISEFKKRSKAHHLKSCRRNSRHQKHTQQNQQLEQHKQLQQQQQVQYTQSSHQIPIFKHQRFSIDIISVNQSNTPQIIQNNRPNKQQNSEQLIKESRNNNFKQKKDDQENVSQIRCPICYENMKDKELAVLSCGHLFCKDCIDKSYNQSKRMCPVCRKSFTPKSLRKVYLP